jgi:hypothetical protein
MILCSTKWSNTECWRGRPVVWEQWVAIKAMDETPVSMVTSNIEWLTHLIGKVEPILQASLRAETSDPF